MATPLKTLILRYPACQATAGFVSKAPFSSTAHPASCLARPALPRQFLTPAIAAPRSFARANSTQADKRPDVASGATQQPPITNNAQQGSGQLSALSWDRFFELRVKRRRIQVLFSGLGGIIGLVSGGSFLSTGAAEPLVAQVPLDPFATLGIMTIACGGAGWLLGPSVGTGIFYLFNRQFKQQIKDKEAHFFSRIKKHRANPANSNASNPGLFYMSTVCALYADLSQFPTFTARRSRASRATDDG